MVTSGGSLLANCVQWCIGEGTKREVGVEVHMVRTVAVVVWIHDEHQAICHPVSKPHADPGIRWAGEVDEDIT